MAPISPLERLENLSKEATRDYISYEQFAELLRTFADNVKAAKDDFKAKLDEKTLEYLRRYNAVTTLIDETLAQFEADITKKADGRDTRNQLERLRNDMQALAAEVRDEIPVMPDLAPIELELNRLRDLIPPKVDGPGLWKAIKEVYQELQDYAAEMKKLRDNHAPGIRVFGGARGFQLLVNGLKKGQVNYVNLVPGTGMTMTHSTAFGRNDVTFNSSGGASLGILAATGTVDDSNTTFTFASAPLVVVVNGTSYRHGHGVSISGSSATLDNPAGSGGDVYGLG